MLNSNQLSHFRERYSASLMDVCHAMRQSSTSDDYNEQNEVWTEDNDDIACGLQDNPGQEQRRDKDTLLTYDAVIRFALDIDLGVKDRIKITKRFGESISPTIIYEIVSPGQRGPAGIRYQLKRVEL